MSVPGIPPVPRRQDIQRRSAESRRAARHRGGAEPAKQARHRGTAESRRQAQRLEAAEARLAARRDEAAESRREAERLEAAESRREAERLEAAESRVVARRQEAAASRHEAQRRQDPQPRRDGERTGGDESRGDLQRQGGDDSRREVKHRAIGSPMLRESVIVIVLALLLSLLVKTWLMQAFYIPSGSMENTLVKDDRVIVNKLVPSTVSLHRGDVIVFEDPDHWLPQVTQVRHSRLVNALTFVGLLPSDEGNHLIKRVIGLPGDHVVCCDQNKQLTVNGVALIEPYLKPGDAPSQETFSITVPPGRVWVMGDHRSDSADSRPHDQGSGGVKGSVPESLIVGRAAALVWPRERWTWLSNSPATFAGIPAPTAR
ncbi:MAG: signal peptidase I [Actinomycetota bacterium]